MGGSTVHGQGDPEGGGFVARLKSWHESADPIKNRVYNLGIGGDAVAEMLARSGVEVPARRPELILLYPGLNDTRRTGDRTSPPQTEFSDVRSKLKQLITNLNKMAPVILLSSVPPDETRTSPFRGKWFFRRDDASQMTKIVSALAVECEVTYFPIFERWIELANLNSLLADGLHCNASGHQLLFEELAGFVAQKFVVK